MKCDELKEDYSYDATDDNTKAVYLKSDVDEAIAEFKAENERLKGCKEWMKKHFYCEEMLDVEKREHKATKHSLWLSRAMRAHDRSEKILRDAGIMFAIGKCHEWDVLNSLQKKWQRVEDKCIKKAEEYK